MASFEKYQWQAEKPMETKINFCCVRAASRASLVHVRQLTREVACCRIKSDCARLKFKGGMRCNAADFECGNDSLLMLRFANWQTSQTK